MLLSTGRGTKNESDQPSTRLTELKKFFAEHVLFWIAAISALYSFIKLFKEDEWQKISTLVAVCIFVGLGSWEIRVLLAKKIALNEFPVKYVPSFPAGSKERRMAWRVLIGESVVLVIGIGIFLFTLLTTRYFELEVKTLPFTQVLIDGHVSGQADEQGKFRLNLPSGKHKISLIKDCYEPYLKEDRFRPEAKVVIEQNLATMLQKDYPLNDFFYHRRGLEEWAVSSQANWRIVPVAGSN